MSFDLSNVIQKGMKFAEVATSEDRAHNYKAAAQAYMAAAEWLIHATKYGGMNEPTKQNIRAKIKSYVERVEQINNMTPKSSKKQAVTNNNTSGGNSKKNKNSDDENDDPDKKRMMQKFEGAIVASPEITLDDVVGLEQAKTALKEAVILPVKYPKLFKGKRKPWAGILLYGPPGTGKSYLAKAIANECGNTFISVTSADILSKWVGEAEKGVRSLFELARERQPSVIFIDEIDSLCGERREGESEVGRRVKTEFLTQMQGVSTDNNGVLVLGATNIPWELDSAIRRRFEKRIYIPLPEANERQSMFKVHLGANTFHTIKDHEWPQLGQKAEHYSGADIAVVCREALLRPIRRLTTATHFKQVPNPNKSPNEPDHQWLACSPGEPNAVSLTLDKIKPDDLCEPPVTISDMLAAIDTQKATVGAHDLVKYQKFTQEFGQEGS